VAASKGRAGQFLQDAVAVGWDATPSGRDVFQQSESRSTLSVESVHARRDDEVLTATWVDGWALGPIGWHSGNGFAHTVKNAATARRCLAIQPGECAVHPPTK
jgi:hypothetical protein